ncbi:MAG TPA: hypothetical protein VGG61_03480 [Gemmataceae bacterium]
MNMNRIGPASRLCLFGCLALCAPLALPAADAPSPAVTMSLGTRHGHATPERKGFTHTGGGNIDVTQPAPDTVVITMTGVAVAGAQPCGVSLATLKFDLSQSLEVAFEKPEIKNAKLTLEGRVIGLLRSPCKCGSAEVGPAHAGILSGANEIVSLDIASHAVAGGENLSINDHDGPNAVTIGAGKFTLNQIFAVTAVHPRTLRLTKPASAEFAPDPALDPLWISYWEPFHGAAKKDFGFQLTVKVAPE